MIKYMFLGVLTNITSYSNNQIQIFNYGMLESLLKQNMLSTLCTLLRKTKLYNESSINISVLICQVSV